MNENTDGKWHTIQEWAIVTERRREERIKQLEAQRDALLAALRPLVGMYAEFSESDQSYTNAYEAFVEGRSAEWQLLMNIVKGGVDES